MTNRERVRHLRKAPIVEALLDLRVSPLSSEDLTRAVEAMKAFRDEYPIVDPHRIFEWQIRLDPKRGIIPQDSSSDGPLAGFFFKREDPRRMVQFRLDGLTLNVLNPYHDWQELIGRTKDLWPVYLEALRPKTVVRLAARYINRFDLPIPVELSDYLLASPELPEGLPQDIYGFHSRWQIMDHATGIACNLTLASEPVLRTEEVRLTLDIDCFVGRVFEPSTKEIWTVFEELHDMKNRMFFGSLTDKCLERFE